MQFVAVFFGGKVANYEHLTLFKTQHPNTICFASLNAERSPYIDRFLTLLDIDKDRIHFEPIKAPDTIKTQRKASKDVNVDNVYSMFYHNKKCMELIQEYQNRKKIKFDCVIKYRSDIKADTLLPFLNPISNPTSSPTSNLTSNASPNPVSPSVIYIPRTGDWCGGINDQIAYGSIHAMQKYTQLVDNIEKYLSQGISVHPETLLAWHLRMCMIQVIRFDFEYSLQKPDH